MRVNQQAPGQYAHIAQSTAPHVPARKELSDDAVKDVEARTERRDQIHLSVEATKKYGQAQLQEHILGKLKERLAAAGVDFDAETAGLDWSPDATAQRIFGFASGLMGIFRDQNPELSESEVIDQFESTVRGAVDDGYSQAIGILQGLSIGEEALTTAQTTIDKVHSLFDDFFAELRGQQEPGESV